MPTFNWNRRKWISHVVHRQRVRHLFRQHPLILQLQGLRNIPRQGQQSGQQREQWIRQHPIRQQRDQQRGQQRRWEQYFLNLQMQSSYLSLINANHLFISPSNLILTQPRRKPRRAWKTFKVKAVANDHGISWQDENITQATCRNNNKMVDTVL